MGSNQQPLLPLFFFMTPWKHKTLSLRTIHRVQQVTEEDGRNGLGVGPSWGRWGTSLEPHRFAKLHADELVGGLGARSGPGSPKSKPQQQLQNQVHRELLPTMGSFLVLGGRAPLRSPLFFFSLDQNQLKFDCSIPMNIISIHICNLVLERKKKKIEKCANCENQTGVESHVDNDNFSSPSPYPLFPLGAQLWGLRVQPGPLSFSIIHSLSTT